MKDGVAVRVDVWADVVCPWCYIGKRRLDSALAQFERADEVDVVWRSYRLEPSFPEGGREPVHDYLATMTGRSIPEVQEMTDHARGIAKQAGLVFDASRAWMVNTFDAHRVAHLAEGHGLREAMYERLMRAHHVEGQILDEPDVLVVLAQEVGVPGDEVRRVLAGEEYAEQVRQDARSAAAHGANGVPFFVLNGARGFSGAQPAATLLSALQAAHGAATAEGETR
jgi:predicted DsbA family dithiol-disulfide isomerase